MHKFLTSTLAAVALTAAHSHALLIDFTAAEGYADGDVNGQEGWARVFGPEPLFEVSDAATSGVLAPVATGGAVFRNFSDAELGGTFDNSSSLVEYSMTYELIGPTGGPFNQNVVLRIGAPFGSESVSFTFRQDGFVSYTDGDGFVGGPGIGTGTHTLTGQIDYATNTYSAFIDGTELFTPFTRSIANAGTATAVLRLDAGGTLATINIDSVGLAIPEPTSAALMLGAVGLLALRRRRA